MNRFLLLLAVAVGLSASSCKETYDQGVCQNLTDKIVCEKSLTQVDYAEMLEQYESILQYLIARADEVIAESDESAREALMLSMRSDEEYLRRFGYMFTFGSTLYQADVKNELDDDNHATYLRIGHYSDEFAHRTEQL